MEVCTLASGSSGNAALVSCGSTYILLDAGISCRRITCGLKELGVSPEQLSGVLITHEHSDHISGLTTLTKHLRVPVYATAPTLRQLCYRIPFLEDLCRPIEPGRSFQLGALEVRAFSTSHDAAASVGYTLTDDQARLALATDLGYVSREVLDAVLGADVLICEENHDVDCLRSGPYPYYLKQRILGDRGHLSNEAGAELAARSAVAGTKRVILAHLSQENNTPELARRAARRAFAAAGLDPDRDVDLQVAPRTQRGQPIPVSREAAPCTAFI